MALLFFLKRRYIIYKGSIIIYIIYISI